MKRLVAICLACALLLCGVCAGAEEQTAEVRDGESEGWRVSNDIIVDLEQLHTLLANLPLSRLAWNNARKIGILMDAIEPSLAVTPDGMQMNVDINGETALSFGGTRTDDGVLIASTLFPSYTISISTAKITQIISDIKPMTAKPKLDGAFAGDAPQAGADADEAATSGEAEPSGDEADEALPVAEMSRYVTVSEPERGEYAVDGMTFDVMRTYSLDCDGIVGVWNTFVNWLFENKGVATLLDIAKKADLEVDIDKVKKLIPADALPRLGATYYCNTDSADRLFTATATSGDGTKVYGEARYQSTADDAEGYLRLPLVPLDVDFEAHRADGFQARLDVRGKEQLLYATLETDEDALLGRVEAPTIHSDARLVATQQPGEGPKGHLDINAEGNYLGCDYEFTPYDASGEGLRFNASLYYNNDQSKPLFREEFAVEPRGALTMDFTGEEKTVVPLTSLINVTNGYLVGFALDIAFNGVGLLMETTAKVLVRMNQAA